MGVSFLRIGSKSWSIIVNGSTLLLCGGESRGSGDSSLECECDIEPQKHKEEAFIPSLQPAASPLDPLAVLEREMQAYVFVHQYLL